LNNGLSSEAELDSSTSDSEFSSELPISDWFEPTLSLLGVLLGYEKQ
jgi:hypothetical protein